MKKTFFVILVALLLLFLPACGVSADSDTTGIFSDVPSDAWYVQGVNYCTEQGILNGTSETTFSPNDAMTRSMLAVVFYRLAGSPDVSVSSYFNDAIVGNWYSDAISWAVDSGIISGYGDGRFGVNDAVTREQMAAILWRYAGAPDTNSGESFADASTIATWALPAVNWARESGIMKGREHNNFAPQASVTRAEVATILYQYLTNGQAATGTPDLQILVGDEKFTVNLVDNPASRTLLERLPMTVTMSELNGNEKYYYLTESLPVAAENPGQIQVGDFMLYGSDCLVLFYEDFSTSYSYTRLGAVEDPIGLAEALGQGDVEVTLTVQEQENSPVTALPYDGVYPQHEPYGTGIGAMPGRVVWAYEPEAVNWDGNGYWWQIEHFNEDIVRQMIDDSIASLSNEETSKEGWDALFRAHNQTREKGNVGYRSGEKVAIKANINGSSVFDDNTSGETQMSYTNPVLLKTLLLSLVEEVGVAPTDVTVYDVSRVFPDYMIDFCTNGDLEGVHFVNRNNGKADEAAPINWSYTFSGAVNYLPTCVTEAEYVINLANLKGHSYGITLCGKNHFGSFINGNTMRPPEGANLHPFLTRNEMGIYSPLTDLMANNQLGGKTVLYMLDALICAPSEGASITGTNARWQQAPFHGGYTASIFVSQDPVAIDSVGADFLMNEPSVTTNNGALRNNPNVENYLHEAGLVGAAPSGTIYYNGEGIPVNNLGVHEHWNNSIQKLYSRNLGKNEGIELISLLP